MRFFSMSPHFQAVDWDGRSRALLVAVLLGLLGFGLRVVGKYSSPR